MYVDRVCIEEREISERNQKKKHFTKEETEMWIAIHVCHKTFAVKTSAVKALPGLFSFKAIIAK